MKRVQEGFIMVEEGVSGCRSVHDGAEGASVCRIDRIVQRVQEVVITVEES